MENTSEILPSPSSSLNGQETAGANAENSNRRIRFVVRTVAEKDNDTVSLENEDPGDPVPHFPATHLEASDSEPDTVTNYNSVSRLLAAKFKFSRSKQRQAQNNTKHAAPQQPTRQEEDSDGETVETIYEPTLTGEEKPSVPISCPPGCCCKPFCFQTEAEKRLLGAISSRYESFDYDITENEVFFQAEEQTSYCAAQWYLVLKWFTACLIGTGVAFIAAFVAFSSELLSYLAVRLVEYYMNKCFREGGLYQPYLVWAAINCSCICLAAVTVTYYAPYATGSGVHYVKSYLNGIRLPHVVSFRTLCGKVVGVIFATTGFPLATGKEGPMIHTGAAFGAVVSQFRMRLFGREFKLVQNHERDGEVRDFVAAGTAAGIAAAFGAPVGGVLFALEEGASFWNHELILRVFFTAMCATFVGNCLISAIHHHPGDLSNPGLLSLGYFHNASYSFFEIPAFLVMGLIGGCLGALYCFLNRQLLIFRMRYLCWRPLKVLEAVIIAAVTTAVAFTIVYFINDCVPLTKEDAEISQKNPNAPLPFQLSCNDGEFNRISYLWFQMPEAILKGLFHIKKKDAYPIGSLGMFTVVYFFLACWTVGMNVGSGIFIPGLLLGACWGRLVGQIIQLIVPSQDIDLGKYAVIGAAAQLAGINRMTISLTVILTEATGNVTFGLPLMLVVMSAKLVADFFAMGIYEGHIHVLQIPFLHCHHPHLAHRIRAKDLMRSPVITSRPVESVGQLADLLKNNRHNGFPVTILDEESHHDESATPRIRSFGRCAGFILRSHLLLLLREKIFIENVHQSPLKAKDFDSQMKEFDLNQCLSPEDMNKHVDLRPYMNPTPFVIHQDTTLPRIFNLFRGLGLRHLTVINDKYEVVGMITRKDLACFQNKNRRGRLTLRRLRMGSIIQEE